MAVLKITLLFVCLAVGGIVGARLKRASGGKEIKIKDAPYFVSLKRNGKQVCGGAFISTQHVLTAAHCVFNGSFTLDDTKVISGTDHPAQTYVAHEILNISAHEGYLERRPACDLAVITLSAHVVWDEKQHKIALPNAEPRYGEPAKLVGFQLHKSRRSDRSLRELRVKIRPVDETWNNSGNYGPVIYGTITEPQSISDADLGAALVYEGRIVGIASERPTHGHHACYFVNVLKFKTFIEKSMGMEPSSNTERPTVISWAPKRRRF